MPPKNSGKLTSRGVRQIAGTSTRRRSLADIYNDQNTALEEQRKQTLSARDNLNHVEDGQNKEATQSSQTPEGGGSVSDARLHHDRHDAKSAQPSSQESGNDHLDVLPASVTPNTSVDSVFTTDTSLDPQTPKSNIPSPASHMPVSPPGSLNSLQESFSQVDDHVRSQFPNLCEQYGARDHFLQQLFKVLTDGNSDFSIEVSDLLQAILDTPAVLKEVDNKFQGSAGRVVHYHEVDFHFGEKVKLVQKIKTNLSNILARKNSENRQKVLSGDTSKLSEEDKKEVDGLKRRINEKTRLIKQVFEWIQREGTSEGSRLALNESATAEEFEKLWAISQEKKEIKSDPASTSSNGGSSLTITVDPPSDEASLSALSTQDQKQSLDESITDCNQSLEGLGQSNEKSQLINEIDALDLSLSDVCNSLKSSQNELDFDSLSPIKRPPPAGSGAVTAANQEEAPDLFPVAASNSNPVAASNSGVPQEHLKRPPPPNPAAGPAEKQEKDPALGSRSGSNLANNANPVTVPGSVPASRPRSAPVSPSAPRPRSRSGAQEEQVPRSRSGSPSPSDADQKQELAPRRRPRSSSAPAAEQKQVAVSRSRSGSRSGSDAAAKKPCKRKTGCGIILVPISIVALVACWLSTRNKKSKASLQLDVSEIDHWDNEDTLMRTFHLNFSAFNLMGVLEILTNESNTTLTPGNASQEITVPCSLGEADLPPNAVTIRDSQDNAVLPSQWGPFNCQVPLNATVGLSARRVEFHDSITWLFIPSINGHFPVGEVALSLNGINWTATPGSVTLNITLPCRSGDKYLPEYFYANFYRQQSDSFSTPVVITRNNWVQDHLSCVPTPPPPVAVDVSKVSREDTSTYPLWHFNANLNATAGTGTFVCLTFNHETVILNDNVPQKALEVPCEQGTGDLEENIAAHRSSASDCSIEGEAVPVTINWPEGTLSCLPTPVNPRAAVELKDDLTMDPSLYLVANADGWVNSSAQIGVKWYSEIFQEPIVEYTTTWYIATGGVLIHGGQCGAEGVASSTVAVTLNGEEIPVDPSSLSFTCQDQPAELDCHLVNSPSMNPGFFCKGTGGAGVDGASKVVTMVSSYCLVDDPTVWSGTWSEVLAGAQVDLQCRGLGSCTSKVSAQLNGQDLPVDLPDSSFICGQTSSRSIDFFTPMDKAEVSAAPMGAEPKIMPFMLLVMLLAAAKFIGRWLGGREEVGQVPAPR